MNLLNRESRRFVSGMMLALLACLPTVSVAVEVVDFATREQIEFLAMAPDGAHVAYAVLSPEPVKNRYRVTVKLAELGAEPAEPGVLAQFWVDKNALFKPVGVLDGEALPMRWSPDGKVLLYPSAAPCAEPDCKASQLRLNNYRVASRQSQALTAYHDRILISVPQSENTLDILAQSKIKRLPLTPPDLAVHIPEEVRLGGPLRKKTGLAQVQTRYRYSWTQGLLGSESGPPQPEQPEQMIVWKGWADRVRATMESEGERFSRMLTDRLEDGADGATAERSTWRTLPDDPYRSRALQRISVKNRNGVELFRRDHTEGSELQKLLAWRGKSLLYLEVHGTGAKIFAVDYLQGKTTELFRTPNHMRIPEPDAAGNRALDEKCRYLAAVMESALMPDALHVVDLETGQSRAIDEPNRRFSALTQDMEVRFLVLPNLLTSAEISAHLYLPKVRRGPLPMVATLYISRNQFSQVPGDEVPIHSLVSKGIAVLTVHRGWVVQTSEDGNFEYEIARIRVPASAIDRGVEMLAQEGLIDAERIGLYGLSYGSEIAMWSWWNSPYLKALSTADLSWDPSDYFLIGSGARNYLENERGLPNPDADHGAGLKLWQRFSASMNACAGRPPVLLQLADDETFSNAIALTKVRLAGARIDPYEYPDEGHNKAWPANKYWVHQRNLDWFRFWLQGYEDPDPGKAAQYQRWRAFRDDKPREDASCAPVAKGAVRRRFDKVKEAVQPSPS
jgi:hypothetical protein